MSPSRSPNTSQNEKGYTSASIWDTHAMPPIYIRLCKKISKKSRTASPT